MSVWETIDRVASSVERGNVDEAEFLALLDKLAWDISQLRATDPPLGKEIPENDYSAIRDAVEKAFPQWGFYNVVASVTTKIGDSTTNVGDAIDDVTDILNDLKMVLWSYQNESEALATWHLLDSYKNHWRGHLRSLQLYVHCLETNI